MDKLEDLRSHANSSGIFSQTIVRDIMDGKFYDGNLLLETHSLNKSRYNICRVFLSF